MNSFYKIDHFNQTYLKLSLHKNWRCRWGHRSKFLICEYEIISRYSGNKYVLCLNYEKFWAPRIWVVEPDLLHVLNLPHVYRDNCNQLCLYHPKDFSWSIKEDIVQTVMFWSAVWLEFYEIWIETGKWQGPEAEHSSKIEDISDKSNKKNPAFLQKHPIRY